MQFGGAPVQFGVRRVAARQFPFEVARPDRLQLVGELVRQRAGLHGGQHAPGVPDDVRIGGEVRVVMDRAARPFLAQRRRHLTGPDPAVAVPLGPAVAQPHAVHHAGAEEPVGLTPAGPRVLQAHRVGPVAQVAAVQFPWQGPGDGQAERGDLLLDRRERASQERVLLGHRGVPSGRPLPRPRRRVAGFSSILPPVAGPGEGCPGLARHEDGVHPARSDQNKLARTFEILGFGRKPPVRLAVGSAALRRCVTFRMSRRKNHGG